MYTLIIHKTVFSLRENEIEMNLATNNIFLTTMKFKYL